MTTSLIWPMSFGVAHRVSPWLAPTELLAGIAVSRTRLLGRDAPAEAIFHLATGPADLSALDYEGAARIAKEFSWDVFSSHSDGATAIRETLHALIMLERPTWLRLADRGREWVLNALDVDAIQCFRLAGLLDDSDSSAAWWSQMASEARIIHGQRREEAGLAAERLAKEREEELLRGTGLVVEWKSLDDATAGYDIGSWRETAERGSPDVVVAAERYWEPVYIEVKSCVSNPEVHLPRGEVEFAQSHESRWLLQVWTLDPDPLEVGIAAILPHVPIDNGQGRWESVAISRLVLKH